MMEGLTIMSDKPGLTNRILHCLCDYFDVTSEVIICLITSYDAQLSHRVYIVVVCWAFRITLRILRSYQKELWQAFVIIVGVTMKAVAFES